MQERTMNPTQRSRTRLVRADDLSTALAKVRRAYGPDAMVVGTRTVEVPDPEKLAPRRQVEVEVAEPESALVAAAGTPRIMGVHAYAEHQAAAFDPLGSEEDSSTEQRVGARLERLRDIATRVEGLTSRVSVVGEEVDDYPLADELRASGTTERTIRHLAGSFRLAVRGGDPTPTAARRHLSRFVRGTKATSLTQMRGEHWFLGRAGSGKTSMVLFLAASLTREGLPCGIISVSPGHDGDVHRLQAGERALGIPVRVVRSQDELEVARESLVDRAVLLIDTPCFVGQELPVTPPDRSQRHLVVPLGEDRELMRTHVDLARNWQPDCVAITQMDLYPCPGRLVDLAVEAGRPVSLLQGRQAGRLSVHVARGEVLLNAVLGDAPAIGI